MATQAACDMTQCVCCTIGVPEARGSEGHHRGLVGVLLGEVKRCGEVAALAVHGVR